MSNESTAVPPGPADPSDPMSGDGLPGFERARLEQCYLRGVRSMPTDLDYAIEMFAFCVLGDPGNVLYLQNLMGVLRRKFAGRKAGGLAGLWPGSGRSALKKYASNAQWTELLKAGVPLIRSNPTDHGCLLAMAEACGNLGYHESQRVYLRAALDAVPQDAEVNRQCARFLANHGEFDQAIACWVRISKLKGLGEESQREIARLQVEKTIVGGHGMTGRPGLAARQTTTPAAGAAPTDRLTELRRAIAERPTEVEPRLECADLLERDGKVEEARKMLDDALAVSGNDIKVREHVEDRQLRWLRQEVNLAEQRLRTEDTPKQRALVQQLKAQQSRQEIAVYTARSERYPENVTWKFELAVRLKAAGNHAEAIRLFQDVLQDARRRAAVHLELGECFQAIRQYQLAMKNYQETIETATDRELELRKRALYRAGILSAALDDVELARKHLSTLATLDYGYRDVAKRLDKLDAPRDKGGSSRTP